MSILPVFLFLLLLVSNVKAAADHDWSLKTVCDYYHGTFEARDKDSRPGLGDTCTGLEIGYATESEKLARMVCEETIPYHIITAVPGRRTKCDVETGLICEKDWIQKYGRCYKLTVGHKTHADAVKHCEGQNANIAFLHRRASAELFHHFNMKINQIWVNASKVKTDDLIYNMGNDPMLVFYGQLYRVQNLALIKVDGSQEKAHTLCEYTPVMTWEESSYLIRKYSEIYWKGFTNEEGMFIRTANHLNLDIKDFRSDELYCQHAMKPFSTPEGNRFSGAYPSSQFFNDMAKVKSQIDLEVFRTPARFEARGSQRRNKDVCNFEKPKNIKKGFFIELRQPDARKTHISDFWRANQPVVKCDAGHWSTAIRTNPEVAEVKMETFSDFRRAPMYCQVYLGKYRYGPCPGGWLEHNRKTGVKWCHKHFNVEKNRKESEDICGAEGAFLDGYDDKIEYVVMKGMLNNLPSGQCSRNRLGGVRRPECMWSDEAGKGKPADGLGFYWQPEHICSRRNVFKWENNVASDPPSIDDENWAPDSKYTNPSYYTGGSNETCLEYMRHHQMNDIDCDRSTCFFCGKEAPIIKT